MDVTNIEASWTRRLPREQYGHAEVTLRISAVLDSQDDPESCCHAMLNMVRDAVAEKLGIKTDTQPAKEPAKKGKSTKKKEDKTETKKETKTDKKADTSDEIPDDDGPEDNIKANPENRVNPEDEIPDDGEDEVPGEEEGELVIDRVELNKWITEQVKLKNISVKNINEVLSGFGVARINDLKDDKLLDVKAQLESVMVS